jgi:predicted nucleic acid-binding protein
VSSAVVLDSGPLGILVNPNHTAVPIACRAWLAALQVAGRRVVLPEIADYEVRRELIRANRTAALRLLDVLVNQLEYLPLTTTAMRLAAELWAQARNAGLPTASGAALDGDCILAAQALTLGVPAVVATANPAHLSRFILAQDWQTIAPRGD